MGDSDICWPSLHLLITELLGFKIIFGEGQLKVLCPPHQRQCWAIPLLGLPLLKASPFPNSLRVLTTLRTITPVLPTSSVFKMAFMEEETEVQRLPVIWSKKTHSMDRCSANVALPTALSAPPHHRPPSLPEVLRGAACCQQAGEQGRERR